MPVLKSIIRNSSLTFYCLIIFLAATCAALMCYIIYSMDHTKLLFQVLDFSLSSDYHSLFNLCLGILSVSTISNIVRLILLFRLEIYLHRQTESILSQLKSHLEADVPLCIALSGCFILCVIHVVKCLYLGLEFHWYYLFIISAGILCACIVLLFNYDDADLTASQNIDKSIGTAWAAGAYIAFYQHILLDITKRMAEFEEKNNIKLLVKKLVIIFPRSCNANGSLEGKDGNIKWFGNLKEIIIDEGANYNRTLKTNVYKIDGLTETYIAAEIPSPLATLYDIRDAMDDIILQYHCDCFVKSLKGLLKSEACIFLEYDDLKEDAEPLHSFLLSQLGGKSSSV